MAPTPSFQPIILAGEHVELRPLSPDHAEGLRAAVAEGELWTLWYTAIPSPDEMDGRDRAAARLQDAGLDAAVHRGRRPSGRTVGMTTYMNIDAAGTAASRSAPPGIAERAAHAAQHRMQSCCCCRTPSRRSAASPSSSARISSTSRAGAPSSGSARSSTASCATTCAAPNGTLRDTCVYSIVAPEWPTVHAHLRAKLGRLD